MDVRRTPSRIPRKSPVPQQGPVCRITTVGDTHLLALLLKPFLLTTSNPRAWRPIMKRNKSASALIAVATFLGVAEIAFAATPTQADFDACNREAQLSVQSPAA